MENGTHTPSTQPWAPGSPEELFQAFRLGPPRGLAPRTKESRGRAEPVAWKAEQEGLRLQSVRRFSNLQGLLW